MNLWLTSVGQGLKECNRCGECCKNPCLITSAAQVQAVADYLGESISATIQRLDVRSDGVTTTASFTKIGDYCQMYDDGCSIYPVRPEGARDYECWNPERTANGHWRQFAFNELNELQVMARM